MSQDKVFSPTLIPSLDNKVKVCHSDELLDPLLCNSIVKVLNYHTTVPYTFMMDQSQWDSVKNRIPFEHDLAIRFGLEYDLRQFSDALLERYSFHTMMYLEFTRYVQKHSLNSGATFIRELAKDSFTARMAISKKNFGEVIDLALSNAGKPVLTGNAIALHENQGPYLINENMYKKVFGRSYEALLHK
ncbi:hypothetical protein GPS50_11985 [Acinetobacter haemolyticus]|uniref:hypothetical protein n=1 Tax=Acinetobacter haemolyticus TaxID=29430 RepID=UPI000E57A26B|nr:hypothetical protein [Acinetobacter haemolyticus]NAR57607.1 hypothetical protein [Acinetobacter haemolyticus]NAR80430.1 hypothetical protein [Acinetobacter haemolyticus]NAR90664.1 hypothetical protein [Acinetobacter haemolyticus]QDJ91719.1 hypothetical protein AhaeAN54_006290 [Acinetobacter haemolyticus]